MSAAIRVLVVDDDPLVRAGLAMILDTAPDLTLVGEAADGTEVVPAVDAYAPDVVLMESGCPSSTASPPPNCCVPGLIRRRSSC
jgi:chemotaxis response regulator CheB